MFKWFNKKIADSLNLNGNENILMDLKLFPLKSVFINSIRERYAKRLILTTERTVFILNNDHLPTTSFNYKDIMSVLVTRKWYVSAEFPVIVIKTVTATYEILFSTLFPYRRIIRRIIDIVKEMRPQISIEIDSKYNDAFLKETLFTKIKFK